MKNLIFISRHEPNNGQVALAKQLGYNNIEQVNLSFTQDPIKDLENAGIQEKRISIVAPSYIITILLNNDYEIIEFVNSPIKREKMLFVCEGAYIYKLTDELIENKKAKGIVYYDPNGNRRAMYIEQNFVKCPIPTKNQIESSLIPERKEVI